MNININPTRTVLPNNEAELAQCFETAFRMVVNKLGMKYSFSREKLEDLASVGIEYAARYYLRVRPEATLTLENLVNQATWAAKNRAKDAHRHEKLRPKTVALDEVEPDSEGDAAAESAALAHASFLDWKARSYDRRQQALGDYAYSHLEDMFDLLDLNAMQRDVFRSIYLEDQPVTKVALRHNIKPNYAYGIVYRVKNGLAAVGPAYLRAA